MVYTTSGAQPPSPARFLWGRLLRIWPFYAVVTLLVFTLALAVPGVMGGTRAGMAALVRSLLFIPYVRGDGQVRPVLFVGWSLNLEMLFYGVFAATLPVRRPIWRGALGMAALVALVVAGRWWAAAPGGGPVARFCTQPLLLEFAAGMALGLLPLRGGTVPGGPPGRRRWLGWMALSAMPVMVAAMLLLAGRQGGWQAGWPWVGLPATGLVLAALLAERDGFRLGDRAHRRGLSAGVLALGDASYALYLTHPLVTQAMSLLARRSGRLGPASALVWLLATLGLVMGVALLAWRRVELPLGRALRARLGATSPRVRAGG